MAPRLQTLLLLLVAAGTGAAATGAQAEALRRGPYLQNVTTTAVTLRWRTDVRSDTQVWLGSRPDSLSVAASDADIGRNHQLRITGLEPGSRYYYAIGSSATRLASGADYYFETAPASAEPTRIWVLGDSGTGTSGQREVRDAYYAYGGAAETDLILMLGDNAYEHGTYSDYQTRLFDVYESILRHAPLWPTFGNHDGVAASSTFQAGPYYDIFMLPRYGEAGGVASGTEAYYSFDFGNIHFVCLNSYDVSRATGGPMLSWLRRDLAANDRDWTIAYFHHPPYSKGSHDSDDNERMSEMRTNVLPVLEQYGVDLILAGHSHSYERSMLIDGHYGPSSTLTSKMILDDGSGREGASGAYAKPALGPMPNAGTVYAVVGVSGEVEDGGDLDHPVMYTSRGTLGSMVIDVDGNRLDAAQLDNTGATVDSFTILKDVDPVADSAPAVSTATSGLSP
jgi:3',5'-cyclic AMP phosphodiesterase CpdA